MLICEKRTRNFIRVLSSVGSPHVSEGPAYAYDSPDGILLAEFEQC